MKRVGWLAERSFGAEPDAFVSLHRPRLQNFLDLRKIAPAALFFLAVRLQLSASERLTGTILRKSLFCV